MLFHVYPRSSDYLSLQRKGRVDGEVGAKEACTKLAIPVLSSLAFSGQTVGQSPDAFKSVRREHCSTEPGGKNSSWRSRQ